MMKTVLSAAALVGVFAAPAAAHEIGNVPCGIKSIGDLIMFGFDTFEATDTKILDLADGELSVGLQMTIKGAELTFNKSFTVSYQKSGATLVGPGSNWSNEMIGQENVRKIGPFAEVSCEIIGIAAK